jgi:hypothetical protein
MLLLTRMTSLLVLPTRMASLLLLPTWMTSLLLVSAPHMTSRATSAALSLGL